jgi:hypothetical protein
VVETVLDTFICQANTNQTRYFYFEAFDEPWKERCEFVSQTSHFRQYLLMLEPSDQMEAWNHTGYSF